jgi:hypothetical protein
MADMNRSNRIPIWVWVVIAVILAAVVFYVATRPPETDRADVAGNEMMVDDPFAAEQPGQPGQPGQMQPVEPVGPEEPVTPPEDGLGNAQ